MMTFLLKVRKKKHFGVKNCHFVRKNHNFDEYECTLCSNTGMEYKDNSVLLKPKTEFRFNQKQYRNLKIFEFERLFFSEFEIQKIVTT